MDNAELARFVIGVQITDEGSFDRVMEMVRQIEKTGAKSSKKTGDAIGKDMKGAKTAIADLQKVTANFDKELAAIKNRMSAWAVDQQGQKKNTEDFSKATDQTTTAIKGLGNEIFKTGNIEKVFNQINKAMSGQKNKDTKAVNRTAGAIGDLKDKTEKSTKAEKDSIKTAVTHGRVLDTTGAKLKKLGKTTGLDLTNRMLNFTQAGFRRWNALPKILRNVGLEGRRYLNTAAKIYDVTQRTVNAARMLPPGSATRTTSFAGQRYLEKQMEAKAGAPSMYYARPGVQKEILPKPLPKSYATRIEKIGGTGVISDPAAALGMLFKGGGVTKAMQSKLASSSGVSYILDTIKGYFQPGIRSIEGIAPGGKVQSYTVFKDREHMRNLKAYTRGFDMYGNPLYDYKSYKGRVATPMTTEVQKPFSGLRRSFDSGVSELAHMLGGVTTAVGEQLLKHEAAISAGGAVTSLGYIPRAGAEFRNVKTISETLQAKKGNVSEEELDRIRQKLYKGEFEAQQTGSTLTAFLGEQVRADAMIKSEELKGAFKNLTSLWANSVSSLLNQQKTGAIVAPELKTIVKRSLAQITGIATRAGMTTAINSILTEYGLPTKQRIPQRIDPQPLHVRPYRREPIRPIRDYTFRKLSTSRHKTDIGVRGAVLEDTPMMYRWMASRFGRLVEPFGLGDRRPIPPEITGRFASATTTSLRSLPWWGGFQTPGRGGLRPRITTPTTQPSLGGGELPSTVGGFYNTLVASEMKRLGPTSTRQAVKDGVVDGIRTISAGGAGGRASRAGLWGYYGHQPASATVRARAALPPITAGPGGGRPGGGRPGGGLPAKPGGPFSPIVGSFYPSGGPAFGSPTDAAARYTRGGFMDVFRRMAMWGVAGGMMYGMFRKFRELISAAQEFEGVMTELKKVMPISSEFDRMGNSLFTLSKAYARATTETGTIMKVFAQQGLEAQQVIDLTRIALIGMNSANMSASQSVEFLTSAMRTWNVEAEQTVKFIDKVMAVQAKFPVTAPELASGAQILSPAVRATGATPDAMIGMITGVKEITRQTGKEIANALKTALARYTNPSQTALLQEHDISVKTTKGYRSVVDVYGDIAKQYKSGKMSKSDLFDVAKSLGGIRRYIQVLALLTNWDRAMEAMNVSANSYGEAIRANALHMQKFESQIQKAGATWREFGVIFAKAGIVPALKFIVQMSGKLASAGTTLMKSGLGQFLPVMFGTGLAFGGAMKAGSAFVKGRTSKVMDAISRGGRMTMYDTSRPGDYIPLWLRKSKTIDPYTGKITRVSDIIKTRTTKAKGTYETLKMHRLGSEYEKRFGAERLAKLRYDPVKQKAQYDKLFKKLSRRQGVFESTVPLWMKGSQEDRVRLRSETKTLAQRQMKTAGIRGTRWFKYMGSEFKQGLGMAKKVNVMAPRGARAMFAMGQAVRGVGSALGSLMLPMALITGISVAIKLFISLRKHINRNKIEMNKFVNEQASATKAYMKFIKDLNVVEGIGKYGRTPRRERRAAEPVMSQLILDIEDETIKTFSDLKKRMHDLGVDFKGPEELYNTMISIFDFWQYELFTNYHKMVREIESRRPKLIKDMVSGMNFMYDEKEGKLSKQGLPLWKDFVNKLLSGGILGQQAQRGKMAFFGSITPYNDPMFDQLTNAWKESGLIKASMELTEVFKKLTPEMDTYEKRIKELEDPYQKVKTKDLPWLDTAFKTLATEFYNNAGDWTELAGPPLENVLTQVAEKYGLEEIETSGGQGGTKTRKKGKTLIQRLVELFIGDLTRNIKDKRLINVELAREKLQKGLSKTAEGMDLLSTVMGKFKDRVFEILAGFTYGMKKISATAAVLKSAGIGYDIQGQTFSKAKETAVSLSTVTIDAEKELKIARNYEKLLNQIYNAGKAKIGEDMDIETYIQVYSKLVNAENIENIDQLLRSAKKETTGKEKNLEFIKKNLEAPRLENYLKIMREIMKGADPAVRKEMMSQFDKAVAAAKSVSDYELERQKILLQGTKDYEKQVGLLKEAEIISSSAMSREKIRLELQQQGLDLTDRLGKEKLKSLELDTQIAIFEERKSLALKTQAAYYGRIRETASQVKSVVAGSLSNLAEFKDMVFGDTKRIYSINKELERVRRERGPESRVRQAELQRELEEEKLSRPNVFANMLGALGDIYTKNITDSLVENLFGRGDFLGKMFAGPLGREEKAMIEAGKRVDDYVKKTGIDVEWKAISGDLDAQNRHFIQMQRLTSMSLGQLKKIGINTTQPISVILGGMGGKEPKFKPGIIGEPRLAEPELPVGAKMTFNPETGMYEAPPLTVIASKQGQGKGKGKGSGSSFWAWVSKEDDETGVPSMISSMAGQYGGAYLGAQLAQARGSSGGGATIGAQLGAALGPKLLPSLGPAAPLVGGLVGGLLGGLFSDRDLNDAVDRNTEAIINNTNTLEQLESRIFNAPTAFNLPSQAAMQGGQLPSIEINIHGNNNPEETAKTVRSELDDYFNSAANLSGNRGGIF